MNDHFPRIITLLGEGAEAESKRRPRPSAYPRPCFPTMKKGGESVNAGLDFVTRAADFYDVSCDYLLGRSPEPRRRRPFGGG